MNTTEASLNSNKQSSGLRQALRLNTHSEHKQAESASGMRLLMSANLTKESYLQVLYTLYLWTMVNEKQIYEKLEKLAPPDIGERSRLALLAKDLSLHGCMPYPKISPFAPLKLLNKYEALGAIYVLEGSTLGGQVIVKQLKNTLEPELHHYYYNGNGAKTGLMWKRFLHHLDSFSLTSQQVHSTIVGAKKTFSSLFESLDNFHTHPHKYSVGQHKFL